MKMKAKLYNILADEFDSQMKKAGLSKVQLVKFILYPEDLIIKESEKVYDFLSKEKRPEKPKTDERIL